MTEADGYTLDVDLGGTKVLTVLVDGEGHIVGSHRRATDARRGATAVIHDVVACVRGCLGDTSRSALALDVGVAGQVDTASGTVSFAPISDGGTWRSGTCSRPRSTCPWR